MFGVSRKRPKPKQQVRLATLDDDDDDDDDARHRAQQIQHRQNKQKKVKGEKSKITTTSMLSFDPDEGMADEDELRIDRTKKRKKGSSEQRKRHMRGGLGYGGIHLPADGSASEAEEKTINGDDNEEGQARAGNFYDKSALEKLRREQKRTTLVPDGTSESYPIKNSILNEDNAPVKKDNEVDTEEAFIPLPPRNRHRDNSSHIVDEVVLTGDEAMAYAQRDEDANNDAEFDHGLQSPPPPTTSSGENVTKKSSAGKGMNTDINFNMMDTDDQSNEEEEGNRQWEDTMVRRAGVLPPTAPVTEDNGSRGARRQQHTHQTSLGQIRASLQPTISNLDNMYSDLESSISRQETTVHSTRDELSHNQSILEKHGTALEYYQGLREDLATWMGALRELNGMLHKVEEVKRQVEAEMTIRKIERFVEWGNDCMDVLRNQGLLASTTMKANIHQNPTRCDDKEMGRVDEFGRDLASLSSIARIKRWNQRRKRSLNRSQDSDLLHKSQNKLELGIACSKLDNVDNKEIEEWKQRRDMLAQALAIIPELVREDYLSISNLCTIFFDWKGMYSEDYASCYADMTLIQMIEVLARLELCTRWDVLNLYADLPSNQCWNISDFKCFSAIIKSDSQGKEADVDAALIVFEVVEKQIISRILDSFSLCDDMKDDDKQCGTYDPFSGPQTESICSIVKSALRFYRNSTSGDIRKRREQMVEQLMDALMMLVRHVVERLGVSVVDASRISMVLNEFTNKDTSKGFDSETSDAIAYATVIQANELRNLVKNVLGQWQPIFNLELCHPHDGNAAFVRYVLEDIVVLRLLPVLNSLHIVTSGGRENDERYVMMPKTYVNDILDTINEIASLDSDEWMLTIAPLRVAAKEWG